jgi:hypothetical protein
MPFKIFSIFARPTPLEVATAELVEAEHAKLQALSATEYSASLVSYNTRRIERLLKYINDCTAKEAEYVPLHT